MTKQKNLKALIRGQMQKTGESYATTRRQVLSQAPPHHEHDQPYHHFPGSIPAATSLRILLTNAGVVTKQGGDTLSEAMVMGIAGGIGVGVFTFRYEKEDFSSFFIAGRHLWHDDKLYLERALERLHLEFEIRETGGEKKASADLEQLLSAGQPIIAWVDQGSLPYRAMPEQWEGGGYHVLVVYRWHAEQGTVILGDLSQKPIEMAQAMFGQARGRIKKQKNRLLAIQADDQKVDLTEAIIGGLRACVDGMTSPTRKNFSLASINKLSDDLINQSKEGWSKKFPKGKNLWAGLLSLYDYIEHYGTGGGLCRPMYSQFLHEADSYLPGKSLQSLSERYQELGRGWTELAETALPKDVSAFKQAAELLDEKAEKFLVEGASASQDYADIWQELNRLGDQAAQEFPLSQAAVDRLLEELSQRAKRLYQQELEALEQLKSMVD